MFNKFVCNIPNNNFNSIVKGKKRSEIKSSILYKPLQNLTGKLIDLSCVFLDDFRQIKKCPFILESMWSQQTRLVHTAINQIGIVAIFNSMRNIFSTLTLFYWENQQNKYQPKQKRCQSKSYSATKMWIAKCESKTYTHTSQLEN